MFEDFSQVTIDGRLEEDCRALVRLAIREDLDNSLDWTTVALVPSTRRGRCRLATRQAGTVAGIRLLPWIIDEFDADIAFHDLASDGQSVVAGQSLATLTGNVRDLLVCERPILNILSRLSGVATQTARYVAALAGSKARLYDTRKTTPGWRRLEKYAVGCGGGHNHRTGLFDAFLIKDNHLGWGGETGPIDPAEAVGRAQQFAGTTLEGRHAPRIVEVEVDSLQQLRRALTAKPQIVMLDNFEIEAIEQAVAIRNELAPEVELEVSGGVRLETLPMLGATGVERISCGALTHGAIWLDLGLDWLPEASTRLAT
jgi:nicotinate-nucleotide pyrophosphorylase (carboxylating)